MYTWRAYLDARRSLAVQTALLPEADEARHRKEMA
jgi:hypothetical protein